MLSKRVIDVTRSGMKQIFYEQKRFVRDYDHVIAGPARTKISKQMMKFYTFLVVCPPILINMFCLGRIKYIAGSSEGYFR